VIAINLLPGARKKRGAKGAGFKMPDMQALTALVKDPWLLVSIGVWAALAVTILLFWVPRNAHIGRLRPELETAKNEARRLQIVLRQKAETEAKRDSLLEQINLIAAIDRERYIWSHSLDEIARALPPYTWLDALDPRVGEADTTGAQTVGFTLNGKSADLQAVTRFVRNLQDSPFLTSATLVSTAQTVEEGHLVNTFVVNANYQHPDTSQLTMQSLASTLVRGYRSGVSRARR